MKKVRKREKIRNFWNNKDQKITKTTQKITNKIKNPMKTSKTRNPSNKSHKFNRNRVCLLIIRIVMKKIKKNNPLKKNKIYHNNLMNYNHSKKISNNKLRIFSKNHPKKNTRIIYE